jgi:hypothetical protein
MSMDVPGAAAVTSLPVEAAPLPDDLSLCHQMIRALIQTLHQERRTNCQHALRIDPGSLIEI